MIRDAKLKQKSIVITLLDLKNAFGEVQHNLIHTILKYHHVPDSFTSIVKNLYDGFHTSITTKDYATPFLRIEKGVLQGDCLSPLLFNLCMNSFIQSIKTREFEQLSYRSSKLLMPRHWLQFADDAVAVSATEFENQTLVNAFCRWCNWAKMTIRPDKCHSFAMKKFKTLMKQYKPKICVNNKPISAIEENESFKYLGRWFSFSMDNSEHKKELRETLANKLEIIHKLPLHPKNKLWLYSNYLIPKLCWNLTIADIDITWIKHNLDLLCHNYFRRWLNIPAAGTVEILQLSKTKFGMELLDISSKFTLCQITIRQCLKKSPNPDIHNLFKGTSEKNIQYDTFSTAKEALKSIRSQKENTVKNFQVQGSVVKELWNCALPSAREYWFKAQHTLPRNIYNYTVRYMNDTLPSLSNLFRWGKSLTASCSHCRHVQTTKHILSGCSFCLDRYTWRHNSVLLNLANVLQPFVKKIFVDLPGRFSTPDIITGPSLRPDMVVIDKSNRMYIIELTVGHESNAESNAKRKAEKYSQLLHDEALCRSYRSIDFINLVMTTGGVFSKDTRSFFTMLNTLKIDSSLIKYTAVKVTCICIRTSYYIFCMRDKDWSSPELMEF